MTKMFERKYIIISNQWIEKLQELVNKELEQNAGELIGGLFVERNSHTTTFYQAMMVNVEIIDPERIKQIMETNKAEIQRQLED